MRPGVLGKRLALGVAGLLLAEIGARAFVIQDGCIGYRPLPPFGAVPHPQQRAWLDQHLARIRSNDPGPGFFDRELGWGWYRAGVADPGLDRETRGPAHYARPKPPGTLRVACFGDSFTYASDVDDADAWPHLVETAHPGWEVPNLGVPGYGTDQALLRFRRFAKDLEADVVCIGLMLENIGRNVNRYRPLWHPRDLTCLAKPRFALERGELKVVPLPYANERELLEAIESGRVLDDLAEHEHWRNVPPLGPLGHVALARIAGGWFAYRSREARRLWDRPDEEPARVTLAIAGAFHDEAIAAGARLAPVVILPGWTDVEELASKHARYWKWAVDELERQGVPVVDPSEALAASTLPLRTADGKGALYVGGGHLAPEGNRVVAGFVGAWIEAHEKRR